MLCHGGVFHDHVVFLGIILLVYAYVACLRPFMFPFVQISTSQWLFTRPQCLCPIWKAGPSVLAQKCSEPCSYACIFGLIALVSIQECHWSFHTKKTTKKILVSTPEVGFDF